MAAAPKSAPHFGDYQNTIYFAGLNGVLPSVPVDFATLEARASAALPPRRSPISRAGAATSIPSATTPTRSRIGA